MSAASKLVCIEDDDKSVRRVLNYLMQRCSYDTGAFASDRECLDGYEINQAEVINI